MVDVVVDKQSWLVRAVLPGGIGLARLEGRNFDTSPDLRLFKLRWDDSELGNWLVSSLLPA